ncbi:hypothetical protein MBLNU457_5294t1 [Dothideomycetes sp. NU457]
MALQQTLIAETIRGMKVALKRRNDGIGPKAPRNVHSDLTSSADSDSDTSIHQHTNRGNKLKRKAHAVREGRLDTSGVSQKVDHAGYHRYVIHRNPPRYDEDGDLVDEDDEEEEMIGSPIEDNPFEETKLDYLLAPLTSAAELSNHPSLALPYTSQHLTEMAKNARDMLYREREVLWSMKMLLQRFRGDEAWVPLEKAEGDHDHLLLDNDGLDGMIGEGSYNGSSMTLDRAIDDGVAPAYSNINGVSSDHAGVSEESAKANGIQSADMARVHTMNGHGAQKNDQGHEDAMMMDGSDGQKNTEPVSNSNGDGGNTNGEEPIDTTTEAGGQPSHAMTTRRKARSPTPTSQRSQSASPVPSSIPSINNFFIPATSSLSDRDFGLPAQEAEETRRMLLLYVQKQEEVVRGTEKLFMNLLRADRRRQQVWQWCQAEGHVGEMSDGEDSYDKEQWGLTEDLIKGKEEEDVEDEGVRKGRRRRDPKKTTAGA